MAGIGFELKKMFQEKGLFKTFRAYIISAFVTIGPTALCIFTIIGMQPILSKFGASLEEREIFLGCIMYSFAFSMILTGGIAMFAARYVADIIFQKNWGQVIPSLYGFLCASLSATLISGVVFLARGSLTSLTSALVLMLYLILAVLWIEMVYISSIKEYFSIAVIFSAGSGISILSFFLFSLTKILSVVDSALIAFDTGFLFMVVFFALKLHSIFGYPKLKPFECFEFIKKIDVYPQMLFIGLLYYLGMYGHVFVYWVGKESLWIKNTFVYNPIYDVPVFCSFLTVLPLTVLFIVKIETIFYEKYRKYYAMVVGKGSIKDIKIAKDEMISSLHSQVKFAMQFQLFIAFAAVIIGIKMLPKIGISMISVDVFIVLVFGCYCFSIMYLIVLILLYFEDRKGALTVCVLFSSTSIVFSIIAKLIGNSCYGYGFFYAAFFSLVVALIRLDNFLKELDYHTFAAQPIYIAGKLGFFNRIYNRIFK